MYGSGSYGSMAYGQGKKWWPVTATGVLSSNYSIVGKTSVDGVTAIVGSSDYTYSGIGTINLGIELVVSSDYGYSGVDTTNLGIEVLHPYKSIGSSAYGAGAYGQPSSIESQKPPLYTYSGELATSSGIEIVDSSNYIYTGKTASDVVTAVVNNAQYELTGVQCKDGVTNTVVEATYEYTGNSIASNTFPYPEKIILTHDYNSEIIEVST